MSPLTQDLKVIPLLFLQLMNSLSSKIYFRPSIKLQILQFFKLNAIIKSIILASTLIVLRLLVLTYNGLARHSMTHKPHYLQNLLRHQEI